MADNEKREEEEKRLQQNISGSNTGEGNEPSAESLIEQANSANERLRKTIEELRAENNRKEQIEAKRIMGGMTSGSVQPPKKEESPAEYSKRILSGKV